MSIENIDIKEATIIDVRTPGEFMMGNVEGSINIPLDEVSSRVEEFKNIEGNLVLCCASGGRSGQATLFLQQNGLSNVHNGGGWQTVDLLMK
ncbi:rhodanese-like domain-containing protein [Flavobacteriales bacterium]|nr:rhodanese-like domain-containing protein [Flavobacteriales bacterium]